MQQIKVNIKSLVGSQEVLLGDTLDPYLVGNHVYIKPRHYVPYALKPVGCSLKHKLVHV